MQLDHRNHWLILSNDESFLESTESDRFSKEDVRLNNHYCDVCRHFIRLSLIVLFLRNTFVTLLHTVQS